MKKPLRSAILLLCISLAAALAACSCTDSDTAASTSSPVPTQDDSPVDIVPGSTAGAATAVPSQAATTPFGVDITPAATLIDDVTLTPDGSTPPPIGVTPTLTPVPAPTPVPTSTSAPANPYVASYGGAEVDCSSMAVGDEFFWTFDLLNEGSCMYSGHWLVDYPEEYVTPVSSSVTWSGGIVSAINASIDDGSQTSDVPAFACNMEYLGGSGQFPLGEAGNYYHNIGMYLTSFGYGGVQASGSMVRIKYRLNAIPPVSALTDGSYLEVPIIVVESTYMLPNSGGVHSEAHGTILVAPGRLYF